MARLHEAQQVYSMLLQSMAMYVREQQRLSEFPETIGASPAVQKGGAKKRFNANSGHEKGTTDDDANGGSAKRFRGQERTYSHGLFGEALQPFSKGDVSLSFVL